MFIMTLKGKVEVKGKMVKLPDFPHVKAFVYKGKIYNGDIKEHWIVTEYESGAFITSHWRIKKEAIDRANEALRKYGLERLIKQMNIIITQYGRANECD